MSSEKLKKRKSKENKEEITLEIIEEPKTLETKIKKKSELDLKKRRKKKKLEANEVDELEKNNDSEAMHREGIDNAKLEQELKGMKKKKSKLGMKKKRRREKTSEVDVCNEGQIHTDDIAADDRPNRDHAKRSAHSQGLSESGNSEKTNETSKRTNIKTKKVKKGLKHKQKDLNIAKKSKPEERIGVEEKVEEIQSVDEDCSKGMKKWLIQYKESRPGLKILQERIDDFITAYEEKQEKEMKEREAQAAEGGWTVVVHHKGRKKTTEAETGVTVGSVAQAAVVDKIGKKKSKAIPINFYRFQKREAQRNEVMMLRSKFEQDKKRIQQLRAARKFRPY